MAVAVAAAVAVYSKAAAAVAAAVVAVCSRGAAAVAAAVVAVCSSEAAAVDAGSRHTLFGNLAPFPHLAPHQY